MSSADSFLGRYGPWAVVTGASDGIGQSFARALARRGVHLILAARRQDRLELLAADLTRSHSVQCQVLAIDLSSEEGWSALQVAASTRDVGLLVCAAGFGTSGPFLRGTLAEELNMLQLNCAASAALSWHFGQRLAARGRGGLIMLSSIVAFQGVPGSAHYAATKAYVQTLAEGLHLEWKGHGVDVLALAPGPVATGFAERAKLYMTNAASPDVVAEQGLRALGRVGTARPGLLAKLLGYSLAMTPRWGRIRIMRMVMRGMTRQHDADHAGRK